MSKRVWEELLSMFHALVGIPPQARRALGTGKALARAEGPCL